MMEPIFLQVLRLSVSGGWLILAVTAARFLMKKAPKRLICVLWCIVGIRLLFPFSIESRFCLIPDFGHTVTVSGGQSGSLGSSSSGSSSSDDQHVDTAAFPAQGAAHTSAPAVIVPEFGGNENEGNTPYAPAAETQESPIPTDIDPERVWVSVLWRIWLFGVAGMSAYLLVSYLRIRLKLRTAILLQGRLWQSEYVDSPFILGLFRPRIYIPFFMEKKTMKYVWAHESAHLRRRDHWTKVLGFLILCIYWFHPLVWLAYVLLCRDIEMACDELVISDMGEDCKKEYSLALLDCRGGGRSFRICPVGFGEIGIKERIRRITKYKKPTLWLILASLTVCILVIVCFLTNPRGKTAEEDISGNKDEAQMVTPGLPEEAVTPELSGEVVTPGLPGQRFLPDLDGNGEEEYVVISGDDQNCLTFYFNGEPIYTHEDILAVDMGSQAQYIDLDRDGQKEIFFTIEPHVNSMPLMEYVVLKYQNGGWEKLQVIQGESMLDNAFPISVSIGKTPRQTVISCEGLEKELIYDSGAHYEHLKTLLERDGENGVFEKLVRRYEQHFECTDAEGETAGNVANWGIWNVTTGEYAGAPCLIATHGIQGMGSWDQLGELDVFFDYDEKGDIRFLDIAFRQTDAMRETGNTETVERVYWGDTPKAAYADIAEVYLKAEQYTKEAGGNTARMVAGNAYVSDEYLYAARTDQPIYLLYDINGDGTEEFFIGLSHTYHEITYDGAEVTYYTIYDAYTWKDGRAWQLMRGIGHRNGTCVICEGGVIQDSYSSSAFDYEILFHRLPAGGTALETVDRIYSQMNGADQNYFDGQDRIISHEEFERIWDQYLLAVLLDYVECTEESIARLR